MPDDVQSRLIYTFIVTAQAAERAKSEYPTYDDINIPKQKGTYLPLAYGNPLVDGTLIYVNVCSTNAIYGARLDMVWALCEGPIDGIEYILIDGVDLIRLAGWSTPGPFVLPAPGVEMWVPSLSMSVQYYLGDSTQNYSRALNVRNPNWTENLRDTAYIALSYAKPLEEFPTIQAKIRGRKVHDHRIDATLATRYHTNNPILILEDLHLALGVGTSSIDYTTLDSAANYADKQRLKYDGQTGAFAVNDVVTQDSGASGTVLFDNDFGTYGVLTLTGVSGLFQDNEALKVGGSSKALANGSQTFISLQYTGYIANPFSAGDTVTGGSSGASATVVKVVSGWPLVNGTLYFNSVTGKFQHGESLKVSGNVKGYAKGSQVQNPRYELNYVIDNPMSYQNIIDFVKLHCCGTVTYDQGKLKIDCARPRSTSISWTENEIGKVGDDAEAISTLQIKGVDESERPNRITWEWKSLVWREEKDDTGLIIKLILEPKTHRGSILDCQLVS